MHEIDQSLLLQINHGWVSPGLDWVMAVASSISLWLPFLITGVVLVFIFGNFRLRAAIVCGGLSIAVVDGLVTNIGKDIIQRPRPHQVIEGVREVSLARNKVRVLSLFEPVEVKYADPGILPVRGRSFPSGHAANNFAVAGVLLLFFRWWGALYLIPAGLVSLSRVYVGVHWPSDILISAFFGVGLALLVSLAANALWKAWAPRWFPGLAAAHPDLFS